MRATFEALTATHSARPFLKIESRSVVEAMRVSVHAVVGVVVVGVVD
jgi:hypothetical protein